MKIGVVKSCYFRLQYQQGMVLVNVSFSSCSYLSNTNKLKFIELSVSYLTDGKIKDQCHGLVGRINGRFGSISSAPITHLVCYVLSFMWSRVILLLIVLQFLIKIYSSFYVRIVLFPLINYAHFTPSQVFTTLYTLRTL